MPVELFGLILFSVSMVGTPGPANMVVMASGARFGFQPSVPFLGGVIFGKQFIIWPLGLGLFTLLTPDSAAFQILKWAALAYILWLAWKIAGMRFNTAEAGAAPPRFTQGLIVHPLNPKAWAMILGALTNFTVPGASAFAATAMIALVLLVTQMILQSAYTLLGAKVAGLVAGTEREVWLMRVLAALTVLSVVYVLAKGDAS